MADPQRLEENARDWLEEIFVRARAVRAQAAEIERLTRERDELIVVIRRAWARLAVGYVGEDVEDIRADAQDILFAELETRNPENLEKRAALAPLQEEGR